LSRVATVLLAVLVAFGNILLGVPTAAQAATAEIWFPVQFDEDVSFWDTYGASRSGGRTHKGVDLMAPQMHPMYAAVGGRIHRAYGGDDRSCLDGARCSSYGLLIYGDDGRSYFYLHMNNDTPGRPNGCDNSGGAENAYAPRLTQIIRDRGTLEPLPARYDPKDVVRVEAGELLGYVGSSGNAGCRVDHIHFETWQGHEFLSANDSRKDNPYPFVRAAVDAGRVWDQYGPINPEETQRLAGGDRVRTAISLSKDTFTTSKTAVIAPAEVYPEALLGAPLAAALGGPVLLHWGKRGAEQESLEIAPALVQELARLQVTSVIVLSGGDTMDDSFEPALAEATGIDQANIIRLQAAERYELSVLIAERMLESHGWPAAGQESAEAEGDSEQGRILSELLGPESADAEEQSPPPEVISPIMALGEHQLAGRGWPDALAAATLAAAQQVPILLTRPNDVPEDILALLDHEGLEEVRIVGGPGAISEQVENIVRDAGHDTRRLAGANRYETALQIAAELVAAGHRVDDVYIATGGNFPDAMAAGAAIAAQGRILLLVNGTVPQGAPSVLHWLREQEASVDKLTAVGGPRAVNDEVLRVAAIHANWPTDESHQD
jgi:murein DD-endopeptidase MepM/ murein hydrolase activator NlpD